MKYAVLDLNINRLSCKIRPKLQNLLEILLKVTWILIYQTFVQNKYSRNYPVVSSINNVSFLGGGGIGQKLTLTNRGEGSKMSKIRLTLLIDSPLWHYFVQCLSSNGHKIHPFLPSSFGFYKWLYIFIKWYNLNNNINHWFRRVGILQE